MAGGGGEPLEDPEQLVLFVKDIGRGGRHYKGNTDVFQGSCIGGSIFLGKDVGDDPPHRLGPGGGSSTCSRGISWGGNHSGK